jgi:hypothetical protein
MSDVLIVGSGPSAEDFDFHGWEGHVCAVSSGIGVLPRPPEHFVSMDHPRHFNADLFSSVDICKHVIADEWRHHLNLKQYELRQYAIAPNFCRGPVSDGDLGIRFRQRMVSDQFLLAHGIRPAGAEAHWGQGIFNNSLLMAVQVMPRMGYDRIVFVGCDLKLPQLQPVASVLHTWHPIAERFGVEWLNASPASALANFLPELETVTP